MIIKIKYHNIKHKKLLVNIVNHKLELIMFQSITELKNVSKLDQYYLMKQNLQVVLQNEYIIFEYFFLLINEITNTKQSNFKFIKYQREW